MPALKNTAFSSALSSVIPALCKQCKWLLLTVLHASLPPPGAQKRVPSSPQDQVPGTCPEDCLGHPLLRGPACCFWSLTTVHKVFTAGREKMPLSGFLLCVRLLLTDWLRHSPVRRSPWAQTCADVVPPAEPGSIQGPHRPGTHTPIHAPCTALKLLGLN